MREKTLQLVHPFLFTIFPILHLYNSNIDLLDLEDIVSSLVIGLLATLALFGFVTRFFRDIARATLLTSGIVVLFYSYGHVYSALRISFSFLTHGRSGSTALAAPRGFTTAMAFDRH